MQRVPLSLAERAAGFRPVLLGVILFWVIVFAASAQTVCDYRNASSWADVNAFTVSAASLDAVCANRINAWGGQCVIEGESALVYGGGVTDPSLAVGSTWWWHRFTKVDAACGTAPSGETLWGQLQWLQAIVGCLWFFALVHGFNAGRVTA